MISWCIIVIGLYLQVAAGGSRTKFLVSETFVSVRMRWQTYKGDMSEWSVRSPLFGYRYHSDTTNIWEFWDNDYYYSTPSPLSGLELCKLSYTTCSEQGTWTGHSDPDAKYAPGRKYYPGKVTLKFDISSECHEFVGLWNEACDSHHVDYWEFYKENYDSSKKPAYFP